jgi:hypothetical protein
LTYPRIGQDRRVTIRSERDRRRSFEGRIATNWAALRLADSGMGTNRARRHLASVDDRRAGDLRARAGWKPAAWFGCGRTRARVIVMRPDVARTEA